MKSALLTLLLITSGAAVATTLSGRVVAISDGDSLTVLDSSNTQHKVRLVAIDAPEKAQAYGNRAKQALSEICFGKPATITVVDTDRYGRKVAEVDCLGTSVNQEMLRLGMAWVYRKYAKGYGNFYAFEDDAKVSKRGLWADPNPIPPWEWRVSNRSNALKERLHHN